ncbi:MAG: ATP-grasp domain-containing protein [Proteobacteria bacterium]|nr:ATP-grasp domain-containing protein [Pseudomonadota bacterium]
MADVAFKPIRRLLIANRGEIARRIIRTAHEMGIGTVAIYADSDAGAPFVQDADMAIALNGRTSAETYLDAGKVLDACKRSGADAVHPGYGFLSENTGFALAVTKEGIKWVGPSPESIAMMGDKLAAKRLMQEADVPTLPAQEIRAGEDVEAAAQAIGYPVLVKASAGGGGRGMRVVERPQDLAAAIEGARREAGAAFGDDTLFLERWLSTSRHVEIQILGDEHGNLVHLFERECSIQRRHQKIIEEAPSPAVTPALREQMGAAALAAANRLGYASAGTVEFLLDGQDFWFLEVNTRLQVEHPITEAITGLDLVREQLRIAQGEPLGYTQNDLTITGHAIEARVYAEDPANDFLPSPGIVTVFEPAPGARFDSGVESGSEVSIEFDPMIAKVIVHAPTRSEAAARLARVLETSSIQGLTHNRDFLVATLRSDAFINGETTTDFIERVNPARRKSLDETDLVDVMIAVVAFGQAVNARGANVLQSIPRGWRNSHMPAERVVFVVNGEDRELRYQQNRKGVLVVSTGERTLNVQVYRADDLDIDLAVDGRRFKARIRQVDARWLVHGPAGDIEFVEKPRFPLPGSAEFRGGLKAPMPGKVLATMAKVGDQVSKGDVLLILEAMKMEHRITAPVDGTVTEVHVVVGDQVANDQMLVVLKAQEEE